MEGINIPTEETLRSYILQTASGPRAMEANCTLAQLLQGALKTPGVQLQFRLDRNSFRKITPETAASVIADIEKHRIDVKKLLFQEAGKIFSTTAEVPSANEANEHQNNRWQEKIELLETQVVRFEKEICQFNKLLDEMNLLNLDKEPEEPTPETIPLKQPTAKVPTSKRPFQMDCVEQNLLLNPQVPLATYTTTQLKVHKDGDDWDNRRQQTTITTFLEKCPKLPAFIENVLSEIQDLLTPLTSHRFKGTFGSGGYGTVHKAVRADERPKKMKTDEKNDQKGERVIALKIVCLDSDKYKAAISETRFSSRHFLVHPNVLNSEQASLFHSSGPQGSKYYLALAFEPMVDGSLGNYYLCQWPEPNIGCVLKQVLAGLAYMHSKNIVHNDLKPHNLLISNGVVKIADFGSAMSLETLIEDADNLVGTRRFVAPEVAQAQLNEDRSNRAWSSAVDIWSLGATLFVLLESKTPHIGILQASVFRVVARDGLQLSGRGNWSALVRNLFSQMTQMEPSKRPSADQLLEHPFIAEHAGTIAKLDEFIKEQKMVNN